MSSEEVQKIVKIFKTLKRILKKYEGKPSTKWDLDSKYDLWSIKNLEISGRKRKEIYFAGLIIQSNYVGFYFMPIYTDTNLKNVFDKELLNTLKGKSCFHIKELTPKLKKQIKKALEIGYKLYQERGWV
jgi:hypothetical protein